MELLKSFSSMPYMLQLDTRKALKYTNKTSELTYFLCTSNQLCYEIVFSDNFNLRVSVHSILIDGHRHGHK